MEQERIKGSSSPSGEKITGGGGNGGTTPPAPPTEPRPDGADMPGGTGKNDSLRERIEASTKAGPLQNVPANFEDKNGDWQTLNSDNLFERLYLDYRQHEKIPSETIKNNHEVITQFWAEKSRGYVGGNRERLKAKYGEDNLVNYHRKLAQSLEQLDTKDKISAYYEKLEERRKNAGFRAVEEFIAMALDDGKLSKSEANRIIRHGIKSELTENEINGHLLAILKEKGFSPRSSGNHPDPFDNEWMTEEGWGGGQKSGITVNKKFVRTLKELGQVLYEDERFAREDYLPDISYLKTDVGVLDSTDKARELAKIYQDHTIPEKRYLTIIYRLNPSLPFRMEGGEYDGVEDLLDKCFSDQTIYNKTIQHFSKGHIHVWVNECIPAKANMLPDGTELHDFHQFVYRVNALYPFCFGRDLLHSPADWVQKMKTEEAAWSLTKENLSNGSLRTWFRELGLHKELEQYDKAIDETFAIRYLNADEAQWVCMQHLVNIMAGDTEETMPVLVCGPEKLDLTNLQGNNEKVRIPITLTLKNPGYVVGHIDPILLNGNEWAYSVSKEHFIFFSPTGETTHTFELVIDTSRLKKNVDYSLYLDVENTTNDLISTSTHAKIRLGFPQKAFIVSLVKYAAIFAVLFGGGQYMYRQSLYGSIIFTPYWLLIYFLAALTATYFAIRKFEKI